MTDRKRAFEALDLPADASPEQIKQAYRELVQIWHPDRYVHNTRLRARAEERMLITRNVPSAHRGQPFR